MRRAFLFLTLSGLTGFGLYSCRREQAVPAAATPPAAPATAVEGTDVASRTKRAAGSKRAVIWIGMDGLDFEILDRLAASGAMPNWKRLAATGWTARLKSDYPLISPVLWTTAATGRTPDMHRVLDFQEVDPATGRKMPISGLSRAVPAVWNLASASGRKVGVVGWWATHPAEIVDGFFVTDRLSPLLFDGSAAGAVYPQSLQDGVAKVAAAESRVGAGDLAPYVDAPAAEVSRAQTMRATSTGLGNSSSTQPRPAVFEIQLQEFPYLPSFRWAS